MWSNQVNSLVFICSIPKVEKVEKKTYLRVRKKRNQLATADGNKVVGKFAEK